MDRLSLLNEVLFTPSEPTYKETSFSVNSNIGGDEDDASCSGSGSNICKGIRSSDTNNSCCGSNEDPSPKAPRSHHASDRFLVFIPRVGKTTGVRSGGFASKLQVACSTFAWQFIPPSTPNKSKDDDKSSISSPTQQRNIDCRTEDFIPCMFRPSVHGSPLLVVHFHGTGGDINKSSFWFDIPVDVNVLSVEYPGYGVFPGTPCASAVYAVVDDVFDYLLGTMGIEMKRIIVSGRSLGSGAATYACLDVQRRFQISRGFDSDDEFAGLLLTSPFSSMNNVLKQFPLGRVLASFLVAERFDNASRIDKIRCPLLIVHGELDTLIPIHHARTLLQSSSTHHRLKHLFTDPKGTHPKVNASDAVVDFVQGRADHLSKMENDPPAPKATYNGEKRGEENSSNNNNISLSRKTSFLQFSDEIGRCYARKRLEGTIQSELFRALGVAAVLLSRYANRSQWLSLQLASMLLLAQDCSVLALAIPALSKAAGVLSSQKKMNKSRPKKQNGEATTAAAAPTSSAARRALPKIRYFVILLLVGLLSPLVEVARRRRAGGNALTRSFSADVVISHILLWLLVR